MTRNGAPLATAFLLGSLLVACGGDSEPPEERDADGPTPADSGNFAGRAYERNFVFAAVEGIPLTAHLFQVFQKCAYTMNRHVAVEI